MYADPVLWPEWALPEGSAGEQGSCVKILAPPETDDAWRDGAVHADGKRLAGGMSCPQGQWMRPEEECPTQTSEPPFSLTPESQGQ